MKNNSIIRYWLTIATTSIKANIKPGIVLQAFGLAIVLCFYFVPSTHGFFSLLMSAKTKYGFLYSALATGVFAAVIPILILHLLGRFNGEKKLLRMICILLFWMWKGVEVDLVYRGQALLFGTDLNFATIAKKVAVDQFVYTIFIAAPTNTLFYIWIDAGCSLKELKKSMGIKFITRTLPSVLVSTWMVWIPAVTLVYSLPLLLQVPIFNLVICFWVLIFDLVVKKKA